MRRENISLVKALAGALVLILGLTMGAPPATAAEAPATAPSKTPLTTAANVKLSSLTVPSHALAQTSPAAAPTKEGKGFFKTRTGIAAIILMAAGSGYMVYSAFHDNNPVHSPIR